MRRFLGFVFLILLIEVAWSESQLNKVSSIDKSLAVAMLEYEELLSKVVQLEKSLAVWRDNGTSLTELKKTGETLASVIQDIERLKQELEDLYLAVELEEVEARVEVAKGPPVTHNSGEKVSKDREETVSYSSTDVGETNEKVNKRSPRSMSRDELHKFHAEKLLEMAPEILGPRIKLIQDEMIERQ